VTVREHEAEVALEVGTELGEGPVWDDRAAELLFVDIDAFRVHGFDPASGGHRFFDAGRSVGAVVLREDGGLLLAAQDAFFLAEHDGSSIERFGTFQVGDDRVRFNDGKVDPSGRFLAGTMHWHQRDACGTLYMLEGDGTVTPVVENVTISNGLAWTPDGKVLYYIDTPTHCIDAFDVDVETGVLSGRRTVAEVPEGSPDGMAMDDEGMLWVAVWGGYRVDRVDPATGKVIGAVRVPATQVSSVAFGGPSHDRAHGPGGGGARRRAARRRRLRRRTGRDRPATAPLPPRGRGPPVRRRCGRGVTRRRDPRRSRPRAAADRSPATRSSPAASRSTIPTGAPGSAGSRHDAAPTTEAPPVTVAARPGHPAAVRPVLLSRRCNRGTGTAPPRRLRFAARRDDCHRRSSRRARRPGRPPGTACARGLSTT
jgi:sugar lactone lactonase YvrE